MSAIPFHHPICSFPIVPLDLRKHLCNYFVVRSFQKLWSHPHLLHLPVPRPALGNFAAGDHYFNWRPIKEKPPVISVLFSILPAFDFEPKVHVAPSTLFKGISIYIFRSCIPEYLPANAANAITNFCIDSHYDLTPFFDTLDRFCDDCYRPVSPYQTAYEAISSPLE
jgi:hypothetical protein